MSIKCGNRGFKEYMQDKQKKGAKAALQQLSRRENQDEGVAMVEDEERQPAGEELPPADEGPAREETEENNVVAGDDSILETDSPAAMTPINELAEPKDLCGIGDFTP